MFPPLSSLAGAPALSPASNKTIQLSVKSKATGLPTDHHIGQGNIHESNRTAILSRNILQGHSLRLCATIVKLYILLDHIQTL